MLLSELKQIKFDIYDYPDGSDKNAISEKVATGHKLSKLDVDLLDDSDFALVIKEGREKLRKFPLCDAKTASVSALFLKACEKDIPDTLYKLAERNIAAFLKNKKIANNEISTKELFAAERAKSVQTKIASRDKLADCDFALVISTNDVKTRLYPINNEHNAKLASEYFSKNKETIPVHLRHEFAKALVTKCAAEGFDTSIITSDIRAYCNNKVNPNFDLEIVCRKEKVGSAKVKEALDTLLSASKNTNLIKIANLLHKLDKQAGLDKYYGKSFSDSYKAVFSEGINLEKTATVSIVGEYDIDPQTLSAIPYSDRMQQLFSQEDFQNIISDPAAYQALPAPYKQAMVQEARKLNSPEK